MNKYTAYGAPCFTATEIDNKVVNYYKYYGKHPKKLFIDKDSWVDLTFQLYKTCSYLFEDIVITTMPPSFHSRYMGMRVYVIEVDNHDVCIEVA